MMQQINVSKVSVRSKGYNPSQPRVPAGQEGGGRWTSTVGGGGGTVRGAEPMTFDEWNRSNLPWILSEVPLEKRQAAQDAGVIDVPDLVVYHVTDASKAESIRSNGIKAQVSRQSYDRPSAAYFFVLRDEIDAGVIANLGINDPVILEVNVPAKGVLANMRWDGLFNVQFGTASAVQYLDSVPSEWIRR